MGSEIESEFLHETGMKRYVVVCGNSYYSSTCLIIGSPADSTVCCSWRGGIKRDTKAGETLDVLVSVTKTTEPTTSTHPQRLQSPLSETSWLFYYLDLRNQPGAIPWHTTRTAGLSHRSHAEMRWEGRFCSVF